MTKKAQAKIKRPNSAHQFIPELSITLMLFEENVHGAFSAFLDASDIQWSGTGLKTCQAVWERIWEQFVTVTAPRSQHAAWFWEAPRAFPGTAAFLLLILALTPMPSHAGEITIGFFLYPKMLNTGKKSKLKPREFQDFKVTHWIRTGSLFLFLFVVFFSVLP